MFYSYYNKMQLLKILLGSFFILATMSLATADERVFRLTKVRLESVAHPWWQELYLQVDGYAQPIMAKGVLNVSVFYLREKIVWFSIILNKKKIRRGRIYFSHKWGPLNQPTQEIMPGKYQVEVQLVLPNQSPEFKQRWQKVYPDYVPPVHRNSFHIGSRQQFAKKSVKEKKFYIEQIKQINTLYAKLYEKKRTALRVKYDSRMGIDNEFMYNKAFSPIKWNAWLGSTFSSRIATQKGLLDRRAQQLFPLRYSYTHRSMKAYCGILLRLSRIVSGELYAHYKIHKKKAGVEPNAVRDVRSIVRYIQRIHAKSAIELGISLRRQLGYLPPPRR